MKDETVLG